MSYIHYKDFMYFAIGEPFAFDNPTPGSENQAIITSTHFVTLAFWSQQIESDTPNWESGCVQIGLYPEAPFLVLGFPDAHFVADFFVNECRMDDQAMTPWLQSESNMVTLALIDEPTNVLKALRVVAVPDTLVKTLKRVVSASRVKFGSRPDGAEQLDFIAEVIMAKVTGQDMMQAAIAADPDWFVETGTINLIL